MGALCAGEVARHCSGSRGMTSRRTFLGLLAAAPVAVPVAVQASMQPRYASGAVFRNWAGAMVGESCHGGFLLSPSQFVAFRKVVGAPITRGETVTVMMRRSSPAETPNRLHGAYINEEGDAV